MSVFDDYPDAIEPETLSDEYLARLAEYRSRLTRFYENLAQVNGMIEEHQILADPASQIRH